MMNNIIRKSLLTSIFTTYAMLTGLSAMAADTEIFFADPPAGTGKPNVLFILNTSGTFNKNVPDVPSYCDGANKQFTVMQCVMARFIESDDRLNIGFMRYNNPAGPISFPVTNPQAPAAVLPPIISVLTGSENDLLQTKTVVIDAVTLAETTTITHDTASTSVLLGEDGKIAAFRFTDVDIPQGATITKARIRFTAAAAATTSAMDLNISVEYPAGGTSVVFDSDTPEDLSDILVRPRTAATTWALTADAADDWTLNEIYSTADFSSTITSAIQDANWCGGNAITVFIEANGTSVGTRSIEAFNIDPDRPDNAPVLYLEWDDASIDDSSEGCFVGNTSKTIAHSNDDDEDTLKDDGSLVLSIDRSDLDFAIADGSGDSARLVKAVGFMFRGLNIPAGATILDAYVQLDATSAVQTVDFSTTIAAIQDPALAAWTDEFSTTATGAQSVIWTQADDGNGGTLGNWAANDIITTPDISSVIQEIVADSDWVFGTSTNIPLVFKSTGTTERRVKSNDAGFPARLMVSYRGKYTPGFYTIAPEMVSVLYDFVQTGNQGTADTYLEAYRYYKGSEIVYGHSRWADAKKRVSHPRSYVNGTVTFDSEADKNTCIDDYATNKKCKSEIIVASADDAPTYISPINSACQKNHIVMLVDGPPSPIHVESRSETVGTINNLTSKTDCADNSLENCGYNLAEYMANTDIDTDMADDQLINTHAIHFGNSSVSKEVYPRGIAKAGGGFYFSAQSGAELEAALNDLADGLAKVNTSFVSAGITVNQSNRLTHRDELYFSLFRPESVATWPGNVKRYKIFDGVIYDSHDPAIPAILPGADIFDENARSWWSSFDDGNNAGVGGAASQLVFSNDRVTFSNLTGDTNIQPTTSGNLVNTSNTTPGDTDTDTWESILGTGSASESTDVLNWVQGKNINGADPTSMHKSLGDPLHSKPTILTYRTDSDGDGDADTETDFVFVGTNHGFIHAFRTTTGIEEWSFIPRELMSNLLTYVNNNAVIPAAHGYGMDGSISIYIDDTNGDGAVDVHEGEKAYMFVGMRRGGSSYYAFDITVQDAPKLMYIISPTTGGDFDDLGQSWGKPVIAKLARKNGTFTHSNRGTPDDTSDDLKYDLVMVFGAGYDVNQDTAGAPVAATTGDNIYMVNALTGSKIWDAKSNAGQYAEAGSISSMSSVAADVKIIDPNLPGFVQHIYAADMLGQIFRFDFDTDWAGTTINELSQGGLLAELQTASDGTACTAESCNRRFYYSPDIAIVPRPNGQTFISLAIGSGYRAHPLDLGVSEHFYGIRDIGVLNPEERVVATVTVETAFKQFDNHDGIVGTTTGSEVIRLENLLDVTNLADPTADPSTLSAVESVDTPKAGWFFALDSGEKVLAESITFNNRVIFTTFLPPDSSASLCAPSQGSGRAFAVSVTDGTAAVDTDNDGVWDKSDRFIDLHNIGIPPEPQIIVLGTGPELLIGRQIATELLDSDWGEMDRIKWRERNTR